MLRLLSLCADINVHSFTVCFCCLLFLHFSKMLWWEWPPAHFAFRSYGNNKMNLRKKWDKKKSLVPVLAAVTIVYCVNWLTHWLVCGMYSEFFFNVLVCLYVRSVFSQSVPKHKHRRAFVPLKSCDIMWWCKVF